MLLHLGNPVSRTWLFDFNDIAKGRRVSIYLEISTRWLAGSGVLFFWEENISFLQLVVILSSF